MTAHVRLIDTEEGWRLEVLDLAAVRDALGQRTLADLAAVLFGIERMSGFKDAIERATIASSQGCTVRGREHLAILYATWGTLYETACVLKRMGSSLRKRGLGTAHWDGKTGVGKLCERWMTDNVRGLRNDVFAHVGDHDDSQIFGDGIAAMIERPRVRVLTGRSLDDGPDTEFGAYVMGAGMRHDLIREIGPAFFEGVSEFRRLVPEYVRSVITARDLALQVECVREHA